MTHQAGEVFVNTALRNTYPNLGLMSEKQSEWVVPNIFYTWEGFYHFSFPTVYTSGATKLNHPLRTALWGSYNWTKDAPAEDYCFSALMGSLPQLVLGNDWSHARAKFFTDNGLYNDIPASPATWDANNIFAYYRGNNGAHYQYQNLYSNGQLYGEGYVNVSSGAIALGRFKN